MRYTFLHHFVLTLQSQTVIHSKIAQEPVEQASEYFAKLAVI